jgi:hypothetical protein
MASGIVLENEKDRAVSPFRFPPSLSVQHEEELRKRGISKEFALASGVRSAYDNELRDLNFQASLPHEVRKKGLQGVNLPSIVADIGLKLYESRYYSRIRHHQIQIASNLV